MKLPGVTATILLLAANCAGAPAPSRVTATEARAAVDKYIPLLESTLQTFTCAGACHHRLGLLVYGMARERNVAVHEDVFSKVIEGMEEQRLGLLEATLQGIGEPEPGMVGYYTLTARAAGHPEPSGPVFAWWVASRQRIDGRWRMLTHRPPMQDSDFTATALSIHLLKTEMPAGKAETTERIERAKTWLLSSVPESTEDEAFRLLGLSWAGAAGVDPQKWDGPADFRAASRRRVGTVRATRERCLCDRPGSVRLTGRDRTAVGARGVSAGFAVPAQDSIA